MAPRCRHLPFHSRTAEADGQASTGARQHFLGAPLESECYDMRRTQRPMILHFGPGARTPPIARELGISHSTVREYLARMAVARITWPLPPKMTGRRWSDCCSPTAGFWPVSVVYRNLTWQSSMKY